MEAFLNLLRTTDLLRRQVDTICRPFKITSAQYNVLRVLQDAGNADRSCSEIARRMTEEHPDMTRLLDRMEKARLIHRYRDVKDRRTVFAKMTPKAIMVLNALEDPIYDLHVLQFSSLSSNTVKDLIAMMETLREEAGHKNLFGSSDEPLPMQKKSAANQQRF